MLADENQQLDGDALEHAHARYAFLDEAREERRRLHEERRAAHRLARQAGATYVAGVATAALRGPQ